jgi:hypothetical protein
MTLLWVKSIFKVLRTLGENGTQYEFNIWYMWSYKMRNKTDNPSSRYKYNLIIKVYERSQVHNIHYLW